MKISRNWLQTFFENPLPEATVLVEALTFHAFEIESEEKKDIVSPFKGLTMSFDEVLDVKVTPNRGHDCLSHRGIAKELSAILKMPLNAKNDPFTRPIDLSKKTDAIQVSIQNPKLCKRYIAGYVKGVKVGPSPEWLRKSLESIGQKSINNIVDATNYVMFDLGQPLHAFDAGQLTAKNGRYAVGVRLAKKGEKMLALDDKEYELSDSNLVIADDNSGAAIGIAGVKGGKPAGVNEKTTDIIIESANFDGVSVRRTSRALKLRTDASERFQQVISPELAAYGMRAAADLIVKLAGGEVVGFTDEYPRPQTQRDVSTTLEKINGVLGTSFSSKEVADVFARLGLPFGEKGEEFTVSVPFERLDLQIPEDLIEEVGRIIGYNNIPTVELPEFPKKPEVNANFFAAECAREELVGKGYSEVYTSVFADTGKRAVANKVDSVRPYLRENLTDALKEAYEKNERNKDLLGLAEVKLFEIGTVWRGKKEQIILGMADTTGVRESLLPETRADGYEELPISQTERYQPFSKYPFIVRDISLWVPFGTDAKDVFKIIRSHAGGLLVRSEKFDEYKNEKTGKTSYAFHLIFQSFDRTLTDEDANERMESVYVAVKKEGWEVR